MNKFRKFLPLLAILPVLLLAQVTKANNPDVKVIEMEATDQMKFTVTNIEAQPGQTVKVILTTISDFPKVAMAHNFVLLESDVDATAVATASAQASDNDYIAPEMKDKIIAYTGMAGGGETVEVTFTVPQEPGQYEYICTFPGHYVSGMKGTLNVKKPSS